MAASNKPKLEFYRFQLDHKTTEHKTFRDFAVDNLGISATSSNKDIFKKIFEYFMNAPEKDFAKNEQLKKVFTWIDDPSINNHYDKKPSINSSSYTITGVINGGRYSDDSILSDVTNKKQSKKLKRDNSVLKYYYIFLYIPVDYSEGFMMIHSNNSEDTITNLMRTYIAKLFKRGDYRKPIFEKFCPKSFQDEFRKGATISNFNFKTTIVNDIPGDDPFLFQLDGYDVSITISPKNKKMDFGDCGKTLMAFFSKGAFRGHKETNELNKFDKIKVSTKNEKTKSSTTFEWNSRDKEFTPVVYLDNRVKMIDNNTPDFVDLKRYCIELFNDQILPEIRPDLNIGYVD